MKKFLSIILMLALVCVPAKVACAAGAGFNDDKTGRKSEKDWSFFRAILGVSIVEIQVPTDTGEHNAAKNRQPAQTENTCNVLRELCENQFYWHEDLPSTTPYEVAAAISGVFAFLTTELGRRLINAVPGALAAVLGPNNVNDY